MILRGNPLAIAITVGLAVLAVVVASLQFAGGSDGDLNMRGVPKAPAPDADSPATTMRTLITTVEQREQEITAMKEQNTRLQDAVADLSKTLEALRGDVQAAGQPRIPDGLREQLSDLADGITRLGGRITTLEQAPPPDLGLGDGLPVGLGVAEPALVWIEPLDADRAAARTAALETPTLPAGAETTLPAPVQPVYTIPRDSSLMGGTLWTALVGRIPVRGRVQDPWPFKLLTGADNLAANGHRIPGLDGMVWSGIAVGDLGLSCVRGELHSVTYVFRDGTIRSVGGDRDEPLGWITDEQGLPCVPGELKTNAPKFLAQRTVIIAGQAAADAAAAAQTTTVVDRGSISGAVTGDTGSFILGRTLAGGAEEVRRWVDERQSQTFDAVFVPPGVKVAINVDRQIAIDYDPNARRVSHARASHPDPYRTRGLD